MTGTGGSYGGKGHHSEPHSYRIVNRRAMPDLRIQKYTLAIQDVQQVGMFKGAVPMSVMEEDGGIAVWAQVDLEAPLVNRTFYLRNSEQDAADGSVHIGAAATPRAVWHVFAGEEFITRETKD